MTKAVLGILLAMESKHFAEEERRGQRVYRTTVKRILRGETLLWDIDTVVKDTCIWIRIDT